MKGSVASGVARRDLLRSLMTAGVLSMAASMVACDLDEPDYPQPADVRLSTDGDDVGADRGIQTTRALDLQQQEGWSFGASMDDLELDGDTTESFDRSSFASLAKDLTPRQLRYQRFYLPTLFQALQPQPGEPGPSLASVIDPMLTPSMVESFHRGRGLADSLRNAPPGYAVMVDMEGPDAVAFAAGLAEVCEPVFLFDNWPHPRGVVPSQLTLAAALYLRPWFLKAAAIRSPQAPAVFVLDRNRLTPYVDDATEFDNRYVARIPTADNFQELQIKQLLYVVPHENVAESDDLNADFLDDVQAGIDVRYVNALDFQPVNEAPSAPVEAEEDDQDVYIDDQLSYRYAGLPNGYLWFWADYGWAPEPVWAPAPIRGSTRGTIVAAHPQVEGARSSTHRNYVAARATEFSHPQGGSLETPRGFGQVGVVVSHATGRPIGTTFTPGAVLGGTRGTFPLGAGHTGTYALAQPSIHMTGTGRSGSFGRGGGGHSA